MGETISDSASLSPGKIGFGEGGTKSVSDEEADSGGLDVSSVSSDDDMGGNWEKSDDWSFICFL